MDFGSIDFSAANALIREAVESGVVPGASLTIRTSTHPLHNYAVGRAELRPKERAANVDTAWDLASLTKVLATTPIAMALVDSGQLDIDAPIAAVFPSLPNSITAGHLLSHSSGFPAWIPMIEEASIGHERDAGTRDRILEIAKQASIASPPGQRHVYSDVGFMVLCALLEHLTGDRLDVLFERSVRVPSGVDLRWGSADAAATEDCPYRKRVVRGEVHDMNAWLMGGVSSHAGLFGSSSAVAALSAWQLRAFRGESSEGLNPAVVRRFFSEKGPGSHRLGWDGVSKGGSAGSLWPKDGVGHLAFTGCSVWMAPRQDIVVAFCTNRVHPEIEGGATPDAPLHPRYEAFRALRKALHTVIVEALSVSSHWP